MKFPISNFQISKKSFTLVEVLIGTFVMLIVFLGIFGAYQLGLRVVGLSKNKIIATAIANAKMEQIRNLPYGSVGTIGAVLPFAEGILDSATSTVRNNIGYTVEIQVKYIIDEADGIGGADECNWDYKRAEIKISWSGRFEGEVKLASDVAPKNKAEEIAVCQAQPGGILSVSVFDAYGVMVPSPLIEVFNPQTGQMIDFNTPLDGSHDFPLTASTYKVVVSKSNYSSERTYGTDEIATPAKPNSIILEGQVTRISFSIDKVGSFSVDTLSPWGEDYFFDSFLDSTKISESSNVIISGGEVNLLAGYLSGYLISTAISPQYIINWGEFSFTDYGLGGTEILYQILYYDVEDWFLIPDTDLPGNSLGFATPPVDLSSLDTGRYFSLKIKGNFSSSFPFPVRVPDILRPNGPGDFSTWGPNCGGLNWECVDEGIPDEDATYVASWPPDRGRLDLYNVTNLYYVYPNPVKQIKVFFRAKADQGLGQQAKAVIKEGGVIAEGSFQNITNSYADYSQVWTTNPRTGFAWTWSDLTGLQIGIKDNYNETGGIIATQVYVVVEYGGGPTLFDWQLSWITSQTVPIGNAAFNLKGAKIIGTDSGENPVYKYSQNHTSSPSGHIDISNLEWDSYTLSVAPATGLDLVGIDPSPQPIDLAPNTAIEVDLYLEAENSLLVTVQNQETLVPVFSATVRLYNVGLGYDITQYTNEKGQTLFIPLEPATYNLEVSAAGYSTALDTVSIAGDETKIIRIVQIE